MRSLPPNDSRNEADSLTHRLASDDTVVATDPASVDAVPRLAPRRAGQTTPLWKRIRVPLSVSNARKRSPDDWVF
jgi:hypothetical protein